jgi:hypothetical protein
MKRIGVLTGGGDVPGLNPCIKTIVYRAVDEGYEVVGIRKGWGGLLYCNPDDPQSMAEYIVPLDKQRVRTIDRTGGTFLHTSRTNPGKVRAVEIPAFLKDKTHPDDKGPFDFTPHVLQVLNKLGVGTLVPIGGDDTLRTRPLPRARVVDRLRRLSLSAPDRRGRRVRNRLDGHHGLTHLRMDRTVQQHLQSDHPRRLDADRCRRHARHHAAGQHCGSWHLSPRAHR